MQIKALVFLLGFLVNMTFTCTGVDEIGQKSFFRNIDKFSNADREGPAIPDDHWVNGVIYKGHAKCYHVYSFGSPHGVLDKTTNVFSSY